MAPALRIFLTLASALLLLLEELPAQGYRLDRFSAREGLPQGYIYFIAQDDRGFLWIGTGEGLARFDGKQFKNFRTEDGLTENFVTAGHYGSGGDLWLGHYGGGVTRYDGRDKFQTISGDSTGDAMVTGITEDAEGNIWVARQRGGVVRHAPDGKVSAFQKGFRHLFLNALAPLPNGDLLLGTQEGLYRFAPATESLEPVSPRLGEALEFARINCIYRHSNEQHFWVGTEENGLLIWNAKTEKFHHFTVETGLHSNNVRDVVEDGIGGVWIGSYDKGPAKYQWKEEKDFLANLPVDELAGSEVENEFVNRLYCDRDHQIWLGTFGKGLFSLSGELFTAGFRIGAGRKIPVLSFAQDGAGNYWAGTPEGLVGMPGLHATDEAADANEAQYMYPLRGTAFEGKAVEAICETPDGKIWVGSRFAGLARLHPGTKDFHTIETGDFDITNQINHLTTDNDGNVWVSTIGGALKFDAEGHPKEHLTTGNGLPHNDVAQTFVDSKGRIWFAVPGLKLPVSENGKIREISLSKFSAGMAYKISGFTEDKSGNIWVATQGAGIFRCSGSGLCQDANLKQFTAGDGLLSDYCYFVQDDFDGNIWIGHRSGVTKFNAKTQRFVPLDVEAGFPEAETFANSALCDKDGVLWFGTSEGLVRYNAEQDKAAHRVPNTFISAVYNYGERIPITEDMTLPWAQYNLKFEFYGLTFKHQEDVTYQYLLEGHDLEWSNVTHDNIAVYQNLPKGSYTLLVKACNKEGACNEEYASLQLTIEAPYWEKWWFYGIQLGVLLTMLGLMLFLRGRGGSQSGNRWAAVIGFIMIFIAFRYIHSLLMPYFETLAVGPPLFEFLLNLFFAMLMFPVEKLLRRKLLKPGKTVTKNPPADGQAVQNTQTEAEGAELAAPKEENQD